MAIFGEQTLRPCAPKRTESRTTNPVCTLVGGEPRPDQPDRYAPGYCFTMSNNYNGARRIPVVFAADGRPRVVVRRETWQDLLGRDVTDG